jgi:rRNA-processing protein FCF1
MILTDILKKYDKIFIDTASFCVDSGSIYYEKKYKIKEKSDSDSRYIKNFPKYFIQNEFFLKELLNTLKDLNQKVHVPLEVLQELEKHASDNSPADIKRYASKQEISLQESKKRLNFLLAQARNAQKIIQHYQESELIELYGGKNYPFTDNVFLTIFLRYLTKFNMCLITQDRSLARDVEKLKKFEAISFQKKLDGYFISINSDNQFSLFRNRFDQPRFRRPNY